MGKVPGAILVSFLAVFAVARAQETPPVAPVAPAAPAAPPANPLSAHNRMMYGGIKRLLLRSAEKMPEENYGFRPAEDVRAFGQILGHAADAQYMFCSYALGEKNPAPGVEKTKSSKADLIAALKEAFAYCDRAYDGLTDAAATETVKVMGRDMPKLGALEVNNLHSTEHYGNLITYLRMKKIVPPSSEPGFTPQPKK